MPVAMIVYTYPGATAQTYFIHTGQIGEPLMLTDSSKTIVWNNVIDPYGTATALGTDTISFDLRYAGQWLQADTGGLAQNWFRDYDASLGRYAEADPLGLDADQNVYGYARSSPLVYVDSEGRFWGYLFFALRQLLMSSAVTTGTRVAATAAAAATLSGDQPKPRSMDADCPGDECDKRLETDLTMCAALAKARSGPRGYKICERSAYQRFAECRRAGGPHGIRTPLHGVDVPL
jgi:RHS repeat-associated protein